MEQKKDKDKYSFNIVLSFIFFKELELLSYNQYFSQLIKGLFLADINLFLFHSNTSRFHNPSLKHLKRKIKAKMELFW